MLTPLLPMRAYIINLDSALDRWDFVKNTFTGTSFTLCRVTGIDGYALQFPIAEYSERLYRLFHGRPTSPGHVGCYLSHVRAMEAFLATDDPYALIGEDDLTLEPDFERTVQSAMELTRHWNILRLTGLGGAGSTRSAKIASLPTGHSLGIGFARLKGTGAYILDRPSAHALIRQLLPMRLPIDHAMDREWISGLHAVNIVPFPASQTQSGFRSSIQVGESRKLTRLSRYLTTYPYQILNELTRWLCRGTQYLNTRLSIGRAL